ncbi:hypothetical protein HDU96_009287 [Phlyctochytrium bullatum]|nr:hypothetical protein HDU96_009287 [Phlyctochytrium bullatum]
MPPKPSKKAQEAKKKAVVEDKTFGLKNKNKSAKVSKYVQQVQKQAAQMGNTKDRKDAEDRKQALAKKKAEEEKRKAELAELFKPVAQQQKVPFGVDPKTVLCNFFKAGQCQKGTKCKFSHDLNIERKSTKIDIYTDKREDDKKTDTMDKWDQNKLEDVVKKKQTNVNANLPTEIVCKYFLEAIENNKYGWFWECPNGGSACKYRHALPPGYVLKKKETEAERREREAAEKENEITFEEFLDTERHKLGPNLTPINEESFAKWKRERKERAAAEEAKKAKEKAEAYKKFRAGVKSGMAFSGKELFEFNPELAKDDMDDDGAMDFYVRDDESDHEQENNDPALGRFGAKDLVDEGEDGPDEVSRPIAGSSKSFMQVTEDLYTSAELLGIDDDDDDDDDDEEDEDEEEEEEEEE